MINIDSIVPLVWFDYEISNIALILLKYVDQLLHNRLLRRADIYSTSWEPSKARKSLRLVSLKSILRSPAYKL